MHVDPQSHEVNRKAMLALKIFLRKLFGGEMSAEEIRHRREIDPLGFEELFNQPERREVLAKFENADEAIERALDELEEEDKLAHEVKAPPVIGEMAWQANHKAFNSRIDRLLEEMEERAESVPETRPRGPRL